MSATNAGIRQRQCTMKASATIAASFSILKKNGSDLVGKVVMLSDDNEVEIITTNSKVFGQLKEVLDDGYCVVTDEGWTDLPTDGTAINYGSGLLGGATAGTVKTGAGTSNIAIASAGTNKVRAKLF